MRMMQNLSIKTTMPTSKLIEALKANRARHAELHKEAVEGYIDAAKDQVARILKDLKAGKARKVYLHLEVPQLHLS